MSLLDNGYLSNEDIHSACGDVCIYPRCDLRCEGRHKAGEWVKSVYQSRAEADRRVMAAEYGPPGERAIPTDDKLVQEAFAVAAAAYDQRAES